MTQAQTLPKMVGREKPLGNDFRVTCACGTALSCQHWQRTSCSGISKVFLQSLVRSREITSLSWAKLSMTMLSYSTDSSDSN